MMGFAPLNPSYVLATCWPDSSFHRWVRLGACREDWVSDPGNEARAFGER
jgi:hypothetical protein